MSTVPISRLKPLKKRVFGTHSYTRHFGATAPTDIGKTLGRLRIPLPNQFYTDLCTAFGEAISSGFKYNLIMSPEWQAAMESRYVGAPIKDGADAGLSMDAAILNSSLPKICLPLTLTEYPSNEDMVLDWSHYDSALQTAARPFFPGIPYKVDGPYDVFDNIRSALHQAYQVDKSVVKVFGHWYQSFSDSCMNLNNKGIVHKPSDAPITLHRYNFVDYDTVAGNEVLVAALSQGSNFGDNGYVYFDRETINFLFSNMAVAGLGLYIARPASFNWSTTIAYFRIILSFLTLKT